MQSKLPGTDASVQNQSNAKIPNQEMEMMAMEMMTMMRLMKFKRKMIKLQMMKNLRIGSQENLPQN